MEGKLNSSLKKDYGSSPKVVVCLTLFLWGFLLHRKAAHNVSLEGTMEIKIDLTSSWLICLNKPDYHHVSWLWQPNTMTGRAELHFQVQYIACWLLSTCVPITTPSNWLGSESTKAAWNMTHFGQQPELMLSFKQKKAVLQWHFEVSVAISCQNLWGCQEVARWKLAVMSYTQRRRGVKKTVLVKLLKHEVSMLLCKPPEHEVNNFKVYHGKTSLGSTTSSSFF